jgi:hypothetical protein
MIDPKVEKGSRFSLIRDRRQSIRGDQTVTGASHYEYVSA